MKESAWILRFVSLKKIRVKERKTHINFEASEGG